VKRPVFSFRPDMGNAKHRHAWEILSSVPAGQKNQYLVQVILQAQEQGEMERLIRKTVREELKGVSPEHLKPAPSSKEIPSQMLDFLSQLEKEL